MVEEGNQYVCPQCHSDNIQKYEVLYMTGTSTADSTTVGLGIFGSIGGGAASTSTTQKSKMAETVVPPQEREPSIVMILMHLSISLMAFTLGAAIHYVVGIIAAIAAFIVASYYFYYKYCYLWNRDVYPQLLEQWHHSYVCMRCGNRFTIW